MECAICLEIIPRDQIVQLSCGHKFHKNCIAHNFRYRHTCPLCRSRFNVVQNGVRAQYILPPGWTISNCFRCRELIFAEHRIDGYVCQNCLNNARDARAARFVAAINQMIHMN